jgi:hypothetical protein
MKKTILLAGVLLGTALTGCATHAYVGFGAPPPPRYGVMGYAPGAGFVWTEGYWDRRGERWEWVSGAWLRPPRARAVWVPGEWREEGHRWRFRRGYWR